MSPTASRAPAQAGRKGPVGVLGLWHLGCVTAACLAEMGYEVVGVDADAGVVDALSAGHPPLYEPGLEELISTNSARLRFSSAPDALARVDWAWVAYDTPIDDDDRADIEWVLSHASRLLAPLPENALVIVSAQLPVGSVAALQERCLAVRGDAGLRFACIPENLRLGHALDSFRAPERIVVGVRDQADRQELAELLAPFGGELQWMGVESAEMTKHALNGFLATSVTFMNEIATVCESVGADAAEVSRGLKSERRIGPKAYLDPGDAFAGGTLARDIGFLCDLAQQHALSAHVLSGVAESNTVHKGWTQRKLLGILGERDHDGQPLAGRTVAVWGLTYKPGTDTLRRSNAVELCRWLLGAGASVRAYDPAVPALPPGLDLDIELCSSPLDAGAGADVLVICTAWPDFREVPVEGVLSVLAQPLVIDPAGWLRAGLAERADLSYLCVGRATDMSATDFRAAEPTV
jgi:UDPglucose 6-dehydrogenase